MQEPKLYRPGKPASNRRCQCPACGAYFNGLTLFDQHRVGPMTDRSCLTPDQMTAKGWYIGDDGFWHFEKGSHWTERNT